MTPDAPAVPQALRADRQFCRYWLARVVSLAGSAATYVALPVIVYRLTGSPLVTGLVAALEAVPYLCFGLVAGAVADRVDRRRLMIGADLVSALVICSVPVAAAGHALTAPHVLVVAGLAATAFVFFDAANFGALPTLVGTARIAPANSAVWGAGTVVEIVVPAIAGATFALVSPSTVLAVDAATFVASAMLIRAITRPLSDPARRGRTEARQLGADVREGLGFLWQHPTVRPMTLANTAQSVSGGAFVGQLVVYADQALGVEPAVRASASCSPPGASGLSPPPWRCLGWLVTWFRRGSRSWRCRAALAWLSALPWRRTIR